jgi:DNA repair protein RecO (recombination protein O)
MLYKTKAIVLKTIKYKESSIILTLFTEKLGAKTYMVNSVRTKKPKHSMALFQSLSLLDLVVYNRESANINRASEIKPAVLFSSIPYNNTKTAQALFLAELLNKLIKEEHPSAELFEYIYNSIELFDHLTENFQNFHLQFLLKLSKYLGFAAEAYHPLIRDNFDVAQGKLLSDLLYNPFDKPPVLTGKARGDILDDILRFYRNHTDEPLDLKSLQVFKSMV